MNLTKIFEILDSEINKEYTQQNLLDYKKPQEMKEFLDLSIPDKIENDSGFYESIEKYLEASVDTSHPLFSNQLWAGRNNPALIAEFITTLRNTSVYTYETAPAATMIEIHMIEMLCNKMGFKNGDGTFLTGSSNANLISLLVARNTMFPEIKVKGLSSLPELCFFVSEHSHYSFEKAANVLGFGENNVIKVKADKNHRMIPKELDSAISDAISAGKKPFYVCGTAGTTEVGAFDPLIELQSVAKKYNLWFHTDGAWGGALVFSNKHKHLLTGIENSDSISWDAHKLMGIPLICSVILLKNNNQLLSAVCEKSSDYLFHEHEYAELDLGKKSIQCGRRVDSLKLWLSFKYYGMKGYEERIDRMVELAEYLTNKVEQNPYLELLAPTTYCNVNFRFNPNINQIVEKINSINLNAREEMYQEGLALFNYCYIEDMLSIRYILANPEVKESDLDFIIDTFVIKCQSQILNK